MKSFDILIQYWTWVRGNYRCHTKWHRDVKAESLIKASKITLANYENKIRPSVSMCWERLV